MADLYEVVAHSITASCRGINHEGQEADGRHWFAGSIVELAKADADSLVKAGAVKNTSVVAEAVAKLQASPAPAPVKNEAPKMAPKL